MCLAVPGKLLEVDDPPAGLPMGVVSFGGIRKQICLAYVPEARVGDYVLAHVGFALNVIDEKEAHEVFKLLQEMSGPADNDSPPEEFPGETA